MNRRAIRCGSVSLVAVGLLLAAGSAAANHDDYWDPRASIPARIVNTQFGVIGLAATLAGDYRTAAVFDHLSGRFPAAPIAVPVPVPVAQPVYYPPPAVVEHVYYPPPAPVVVQHVHAVGCGHPGYYGGGYGYGGGHHHGYRGRGHDYGYYGRGQDRGHHRGYYGPGGHHGRGRGHRDWHD